MHSEVSSTKKITVNEQIAGMLFVDGALGHLPNSMRHLLRCRTHLSGCRWWCTWCTRVLSFRSVQVTRSHNRLTQILIMNCYKEFQSLSWLDTLLVNHQIILCCNSCGQPEYISQLLCGKICAQQECSVQRVIFVHCS